MTSSNEKILIEENGQYQFDFSAMEYVWEMDAMTVGVMLSDVDYITESKHEVLFIEYKNANIKDAVRPEAMLKKIKHGDFYQSIARKFFDSLLLFWARKANEKELPIVYVLIIEGPSIDKKIRRQLKLKIMKQLPFKLKENFREREIISSFEVYNLAEWAEKFPDIKIMALNL